VLPFGDPSEGEEIDEFRERKLETHVSRDARPPNQERRCGHEPGEGGEKGRYAIGEDRNDLGTLDSSLGTNRSRTRKRKDHVRPKERVS